MEAVDILLVVGAGFAAGFINTVAGGGSLISLPILIFLGLPPAVANASNRVAIFSQNIFGVLGFKSKGVSAFPFSLWLGLSALVGAVIGAKIAVDIPEDLFNKLLAIIMIVVVAFIIKKSVQKEGAELLERMGTKHQVVSIALFFFVGIWGGFIQAGVGFLIIMVLTSVNRFSLVKTNSAKVLVVLIYTSAALVVFVLEGTINWWYGGLLAVGNSSGAWVASRWSVEKGDRWVLLILVISVVAMAGKLWFLE
ncbi:sulfite exporter TauE/SafE family protein [Tunicatimonas pelagia]|uniref:sulfite exporter TauE/SafE family protein n=1 Tax=Tunicatimonas pelagia TaxID=931531 RepID=UPI00266583D3|nr:sulfite exporter TauE/SafE family protein [Tunicatimonas pelagia]WKN42040.1 sulfite exporter TauE/SafE family protein [Tunicatimonas pelagia]